MDNNTRTNAVFGFVLRTLQSNCPNNRIEVGNGGGPRPTLKPVDSPHVLEQNSSPETITELKEMLGLVTETNKKLTSRLKSSEAHASKLVNAKSHLVRKVKECHVQLRSLEKASRDTSVRDALTAQLHNLQLEHDALTEKYHETKKQQQYMALRSNQVTELQSEISRLRRIHTLEARLLDLFREMGRTRNMDHSRYSPLGKAIRQAEQELAKALEGET